MNSRNISRRRLSTGIERRLKIAALFVAVAAIVLIASNSNACFVCIIPYQSLLDKVESSQHVVIGHAIDSQKTQWQVDRVIRGEGVDAGQTITVEAKISFPGESQLLRREALEKPWIVETDVERPLVQFLVTAVELSSKSSAERSVREQAQYLRFFLPYLEYAHPQIADSAYNKIARAPYEVLRKIGTEIDPKQLLAWIENPQIAPKRGSLYITLLGICGGESELALIQKWIDAGWERQNTENLGALLAAHAELNGEETIRFIENSYIQNRERTLGELIAAINTLRVHGQADGKISRARTMASFHLLIRERPALVEMIIEDCARWEDWTIAPKLMSIYASGKQPWNNAMTIKYLEACPTPEAKQFVHRIASIDRPTSSDELKTRTSSKE